MSTRVALLTLVAFVTCLADTCPDDYKCAWHNGWFELSCYKTVGEGRFKPVKGIITDLPTNAARLKIKCDVDQVPVQLNFANLPNVRELTIDSVNDVSRNRLFHGVSTISHLVLRSLPWNRIVNGTFSGLSNLVSLTVENLDVLNSIDEDIMLPLVSLQSLKFRNIGSFRETLRYDDYARMLGRIRNTNFHTLVLNAIHSSKHDETILNIDDLFKYGSVNMVLKHLDLGRNHISIFKGIPAHALPVIQYISLAENVPIGTSLIDLFWLFLFGHNHLENLDISGMNTMATNARSEEKLFSLTTVDHDGTVLPLTIGQRLCTISMANSIFFASVNYVPFQIRFVDKYRVLKYIDFSGASTTVRTIYNVADLRALEYVNLQNINMAGIDVDLFNLMPNLTTLLLGGNDLGNIFINDRETGMFRKTDQLRILDMARCNLTEIHASEFSRLSQLQNLNLSRNNLHEFRVELQNVMFLRLLNLSHNKLTTLSVTMRTELDNLAVDLDISGNPLDCSCNNTQFLKWTQTAQVNFFNKDATFCVNGNDTWTLFSGWHVADLDQMCHGDVVTTTLVDLTSQPKVTSKRNATSAQSVTTKPNNRTYVKSDATAWKNEVIIVLSVILLVLMIAIPIVVYVLRRYRWKLALHCRRFCTGDSTSDVEDEDAYERDAFICFNSNDRGWVCHDLLQHMEEHEITTIIHHRDFLPGSVLEESIRESIDKCRFTVLVLSPDFLTSNWCLLEMHLARYRVISQGRDVIVPIILREFSASLLTRTLEGILSTSYLEWTDDPEGQVLFWDKLVTKLKHGGNIRPLKM